MKFILGEDRYVRYRVTSTSGSPFVIASAAWELQYDGETEASGSCEIETTSESTEHYLRIRLAPQKRSIFYLLELTLSISDETIKMQERVEVV